ncbi:MAG: hypothetical protein M1837_003651 [Sclerophora amabilis]|nr:MAG: hypothetical protein M1837_003651 [Sclerophora amabilis]
MVESPSMASTDASVALAGAPAEDPIKDDLGLHEEEGDDRPVAPDQFDEKYETTRKEIWSYYAFYIGNNGLTLFNFAPTAFQNLLSQAAGDAEVLRFAGKYVGDRG